ncbi:MAG: glycosyltransferase family 4 protein [Actinobacteria bacterium]|nr:glycosyltransferase family 4 protein [Actinomycetota bacterium]
MRVLILSQWFDPEPFFKGLPFAKALRDLGHDVQVLTGFPNYPGGKVYPPYKIRLFQREVMEGIPVTRVALYPSHDRSSLKRILNYTSFAVSAALLGPLLIRDIDIIYTYHPPGTIGLPALVMKAAKRAPVVYDIQDLWPDSVRASGMLDNKVALWVLSKLCGVVYRFVDRIVVLSPGFKEELTKRGVAREKIEIIYNWCDEQALASGDEAIDEDTKEIFRDKFNVLFAGNMGKGQGLEAVVDAAEILRERQPKVQIVLVGDGTEAEKLKERARQKKLDNIVFLGRKPVDEIGGMLRHADVLLVHLKDDPLFRITIPSKTQAYMAIGKPILMGVKGDASRLVLDAGAGIVCAPGDSRSIAEGISSMYLMEEQDLKNMGERARVYYYENLSIFAGTRSFDRLFASLLQQYCGH